MTYEIWSQLLETLSQEPDRIFSLDELEFETNLNRESIQQSLYRARLRGDVDRIAPGRYRFCDKYRRQDDTKYSGSIKKNDIHIKDADYEIVIHNASLQTVDEILGQLKYIRKQIKRNR